MNRRETIKSILLGSVVAGIGLNGCLPEKTSGIDLPQIPESPLYGRTDAEILRDKELFEKTFFSEHELSTIAVLCDIILPKTDTYNSATETGITEFVEFMVKDMINLQIPIRGGLMWLDNFSNKLYDKEFVVCLEEEQFYICDQIAYPKKTIPELMQGEAFFTRIRNLTLTGYFTSKVGIADLGYKGNVPNVWDGVPKDVLNDHGLKYDDEWLAKCVDQTRRGDIAVWDDDGNLVS